jgi:hypothetical protein
VAAMQRKLTLAFNWLPGKQAGYAACTQLLVVLIDKLQISQLNKIAGGLVETVDQLNGTPGNGIHYLISGFIGNRLQYGDLFLVTDVTENRGSIVLHAGPQSYQVTEWHIDADHG